MRRYPMSFWTGVPKKLMDIAVDAVSERDSSGLPIEPSRQEVERILRALAHDGPTWLARENASKEWAAAKRRQSRASGIAGV